MANPMLETTLYLVGAVANRGRLDSDIEQRWHHLLTTWRLIKEGTSANLMSHLQTGIDGFDNAKHSYVASMNPWSTSNYSKLLEGVSEKLNEACAQRAQLLRFKSKTLNPETPVSQLISNYSDNIDEIQRQMDTISGSETTHKVDGMEVKGNALDLQVAWMLLRISDLRQRFVLNPEADASAHVYNIPKNEMQALSVAYQKVGQMMPMVFPKSNVIPKKECHTWQNVLDATPEGVATPEGIKRAQIRATNENFEWLMENLNGTRVGHREQGKTLEFNPALVEIMASEFRELSRNHQQFKQVSPPEHKVDSTPKSKPEEKAEATEESANPLAQAVAYCIKKRLSERELSEDAKARYHRTRQLVNELDYSYPVRMMQLIKQARDEFGKGWTSKNYIKTLDPFFTMFEEASDLSMRTKSPAPLNEAFDKARPWTRTLSQDVANEFDKLRAQALEKKKPFPSTTDVDAAWLHLNLASYKEVYPKGLELQLMMDMLGGLERIMTNLPTELPRNSSHKFTAGETGQIRARSYLTIDKAANNLNWSKSTAPDKAVKSLQFITSHINGQFKAFQSDIVETAKAYEEQGKPMPFDKDSLLKLLGDMSSAYSEFVAKARLYWDDKAKQDGNTAAAESSAESTMLNMYNKSSSDALGLSDLVRESEGPTTRSKSAKTKMH